MDQHGRTGLDAVIQRYTGSIVYHESLSSRDQDIAHAFCGRRCSSAYIEVAPSVKPDKLEQTSSIHSRVPTILYTVPSQSVGSLVIQITLLVSD